MGNSLIDIVRAERSLILDRFVLRVRDTIPHYNRIPAPELRKSIDSVIGDILGLFETGDRQALTKDLMRITKERIAQGFSPGDFLRAVLTGLPILREIARVNTPGDHAEYVEEYAAIENTLNEVTVIAANIYMDEVSRRINAKNSELNRLNQRLQIHERSLNADLTDTVRALSRANEFNQRVIESLSSGVIVIATDTRKVSLYSTRAEEILGLPSEEVLGRDVAEAVAPLDGFDPESLIATVQSAGRLPLTKLHIGLPNGQARDVFVRAERLYDDEGNPEGTVVVIDDVTERELLIDSFSRYVSRDVLQRLLARGKLDLEGEKRVCTILFADIRGFSRIAEALDPEALHELLNEYFRVMIASITEHGGFIDKFVGDNVMAIFGSKADPAGAARSALHAARAIKDAIAELNETRSRAGERTLTVGIGVNTGEVVLGNVGSEERMNFTAIGDVVNVADRLQEFAQEGQIFVGKETARLVGDAISLHDCGETEIRGRKALVRMFELRIE